MDEHPNTDWPWRPLVYALVLALVGYAVHRLIAFDNESSLVETPWRAATACALWVGALGGCLIADRGRWGGALGAALALAALAGGISYWRLQGQPWSAAAAALVLPVAFVLCPFAQSAGRPRWCAPDALSRHTWQNAVALALAGGFALLALGLYWALSGLFAIIGVEQPRAWLQRDDFHWLFEPFAAGAALGAVIEQRRLLGATLAIAQSVLALLAAPLAAALSAFLGALALTGPAPLWAAQTSPATTLLALAAVAVLALHAVIRSRDEDIRTGRLGRAAARALGPLAAALSALALGALWLRIEQYGWTPQRLWALSAAVIGAGWAALSAVAALLPGWSAKVRAVTVALALASALAGALLASPLRDFGALASEDQLARLADGRTAAADFDAAALAFEFGPAGRAALAQLRERADGELAAAIDAALAAEDRWSARDQQLAERARGNLARLQLHGAARAQLPAALLEALAQTGACPGDLCQLFWRPGAPRALLVHRACQAQQRCADAPGEQLSSGEQRVHLLTLEQGDDGQWAVAYPGALRPAFGPSTRRAASERALVEAALAGRLAIEPITRWQLIADGYPIGPPLDAPGPAPAPGAD